MTYLALSRVALVAVALGAVACGGDAASPEPVDTIRIDGSSTVAPITEAIAEEFIAAHPGARPIIGVSGTGGGFQKFCAGETDISNASRPIKSSEIEACARAGIDFIELPIAYDGIAVVAHPENTWVDAMTVDELGRLWEPHAQGTIVRWNQIRPTWPDREIHLLGPGIDSGTYDYFSEAIVGEEGASRGDYTASEDDNVLVQGVARDSLALGFMGLAYYEQNASRLKLVGVDDGNAANGSGPIVASARTVQDGTYQPLSRPLFIYVAATSAARRDVQQFVDLFFARADLVREVGYIPLPEPVYARVRQLFEYRQTGTAFGTGGSQVGMTVDDLLSREP